MLNLIRKEVPTLSLEDSVAKAINLMHTHSIKQIPVLDLDNKYSGMIYYKDFINNIEYQCENLLKYLPYSNFSKTELNNFITKLDSY